MKNSQSRLGRCARTLNSYRRFQNDRSGNVAIMVGMFAVPLMLCVGGALDFLQASRVKTRLQSAADAAVMGAMSTRGLSDSQREVIAGEMFNANATLQGVTAGATATTTIQNGTATLTSTVVMPTALLRVAGIDTLEISVRSVATATGKKIELALMTDVTGSMGETRNGQTKIDGLKEAANDLLDILLPNVSLNDEARVSLVPFANYVNAGQYASAVTGLSPTRNNQGAIEYLQTCVTERTGTEAATDAVAGLSKWIGPKDPGNSNNNYGAVSACTRAYNGNHVPLPAIVPLTNDKSLLKSMINSFTPAGGTAGHIGTAWSLYTLSPEWNSVFNLSTPPRPYNDPEYAKFAVLMTDGEYNTQYSSADSKTQALALCQSLKDKGIKVFTVGLGFDQNGGGDAAAKDTLMQCASGTGHYFFPYDGNALKVAFTQIGNQVTTWAGKVRMTQ